MLPRYNVGHAILYSTPFPVQQKDDVLHIALDWQSTNASNGAIILLQNVSRYPERPKLDIIDLTATFIVGDARFECLRPHSHDS